MTKNSILTGENPFYKQTIETEAERIDEKYKDPWKAPKKGSSAWNAAQQRKKAEREPEEVKRVDTIGNKNHMVGTAKVTHKEEVDLDLQESFDLLDQYENLLEQLISIEEKLQEQEIDLDEYFAEEEVEEGFEGSSRMQRLLAQKKAALRKRLRAGYSYKKKK